MKKSCEHVNMYDGCGQPLLCKNGGELICENCGETFECEIIL